MTSVTKFFEDNINYLDSQKDPVQWNLNQGLLALAKQIQRIENDQNSVAREVKSLDHFVRSHLR